MIRYMTAKERARKEVADRLWQAYLSDLAKGIPASESPGRIAYNMFIFGAKGVTL